MWKQVLSGLRIAFVLIAVAMLSMAILDFVPVRRIEAYYWHLRHGNSVEVAGYLFPVPKQWYLSSQLADDVLLVDLNTGDSITVRRRSVPLGFPTLAAWEAAISHPMLDGSNKVLERRELHVSGETILCVEVDLDTKALHLYPIWCRSESGLEVTYAPYVSSAKDHDPIFYSLLQQVRKL